MTSTLSLVAFGIGLGALACSRRDSPAPSASASTGAASRLEVVRVAAASDLAGTLDEIAEDFRKRTGTKLSLSFGASGLFAKQLEQGAPFDVFAAADASFIERAVRAGACDGSTRARYARGRLGLFTRDDAGPAPAAVGELTNPRFRRIAIANPEHAPYGRAAREALTKSGLWTSLEPRLVYAENVRQALQMAESGNAEAALVAYSHAQRAKAGKALEIDATLFTPLDQVVVVCRHGKNAGAGAEFARYLRSPEARDVFSRRGFLAPREDAP
jgi:molybdate transport system substrate-binding protein